MLNFATSKPHTNVKNIWLKAFMFLLSIVLLALIPHQASAQTVCPAQSVNQNQVARFAYHVAETGLGNCTNAPSIPVQGVRVYSSWIGCANRRFLAIGENGGSHGATSLTCDNCTSLSAFQGRVAAGTSANFRAYFNLPGVPAPIRYDGTFSVSAAAPFTCTLSGSIQGSTFGGDATRPTAAIGALSGPVNGKYTAVITLSEPSADLAVADLTLENATAVISGSGANYTATLTPAASGEVAVTVAAKSFSDNADNQNQNASNRVRALFIGTIPTVSIAAFTGPVDGKFTAAITLSENSTNFELADLSLTNATATLSGSGANYTAVLTPSGDGTIKLSVPAATFTGVSSLDNTASNEVIAQFDGTPPSATISGVPETFLGTQEFSATIVFSESVTGFTLDDIIAANATVTAVTGSGTSFSTTIKPSGKGDVRLSIPADKAFDTAGNGNTASNTVVIENKTVEKTQKQISQFISGRANLLLANQPNLICLLEEACSQGKFDLDITDNLSSFDLASRRDHPVWFNLKATHSKSGSAKSDYIFGVVGTLWKIAPKTVLGFTVEFDYKAQSDGIAKTSGTGWLAGPYIAGRFSPDHPLYYEARALWG